MGREQGRITPILCALAHRLAPHVPRMMRSSPDAGLKRGNVSSQPKPIQIILARQFASTLAMPILIVDTEGTLIFYNEPAEAILDQRFDETGEMSADLWSTLFAVEDEDRKPIATGGPADDAGADGAQADLANDVDALPVRRMAARDRSRHSRSSARHVSSSVRR